MILGRGFRKPLKQMGPDTLRGEPRLSGVQPIYQKIEASGMGEVVIFKRLRRPASRSSHRVEGFIDLQKVSVEEVG